MHAPENEKGLHTWYISYVDTEHYDLVLLCYHHCLIQTIISVWIDTKCTVHGASWFELQFNVPCMDSYNVLALCVFCYFIFYDCTIADLMHCCRHIIWMTQHKGHQ